VAAPLPLVKFKKIHRSARACAVEFLTSEKFPIFIMIIAPERAVLADDMSTNRQRTSQTMICSWSFTIRVCKF